MAITYHAGRRIQGLSTDFSADILNEDFDYVSQTAANNVWVPQNNTGNKRVNISTDKFEHSFGGGGSTTNSNCVYDLGAGNVSNTKWVLDFTAVVASVHRPNNVNNSSNFGLFTEDGTAANGSGTGGKGVCLGFGNQSADTKFWAITRTDSTGTDGFNRIGTQFSTNDSTGTYFIRMVRDNNNVTVSIHTAASRTSANLTEEETVSVTGMTGLRWLGSKNYIINASSNNFSFNIDDVVFYNDVTNITDPVYPSNVQLGSRIEETDTRKMYYYVEQVPDYDYPMTTDPRTNTWNVSGYSTITHANSTLQLNLTAGTSGNSAGSVTYIDLGSTLSNKWVMRFRTKQSSYSTYGYNSHHFVGLSSTPPSGTGNITTSNWIGTRWYYGTQFSTDNKIGVEPRISKSSSGDHNNSTSVDRLYGRPNAVTNTTTSYYHEYIWNVDTFTYNLYTNENYTGTPEATAVLSSSSNTQWVSGTPSTITGLQYLVYYIASDSAEGTFVSQLDDVEIWDGVIVAATGNAWSELGT